MTRPTLHLVPEAALGRPRPGRAVHARRYAEEGFVHCTDGDEEMVKTANRFYRDDPQPFLLLTVDLDATGSPWRFDEPGLAVPPRLRPDRARGDPRGPPLRARPGRDVHGHHGALVTYFVAESSTHPRETPSM